MRRGAGRQREGVKEAWGGGISRGSLFALGKVYFANVIPTQQDGAWSTGKQRPSKGL